MSLSIVHFAFLTFNFPCRKDICKCSMSNVQSSCPSASRSDIHLQTFHPFFPVSSLPLIMDKKPSFLLSPVSDELPNGWVIEAVSEWASERKSDRIFSDPFQRGAVLIVFYLSISKTINLKLEYSRNSVWQISWLWVINTTGCPIKKVHVRIAYLCKSKQTINDEQLFFKIMLVYFTQYVNNDLINLQINYSSV